MHSVRTDRLASQQKDLKLEKTRRGGAGKGENVLEQQRNRNGKGHFTYIPTLRRRERKKRKEAATAAAKSPDDNDVKYGG